MLQRQVFIFDGFSTSSARRGRSAGEEDCYSD
jgi:hypothetical protein